MSENFHTPIAVGASNDPSSVNTPLGTLDSQITSHNGEITNARGAYATIAARLNAFVLSGGNISTTTNGAQGSSTTLNVVDGSAFVSGARIAYTTTAGDLEYRTIASGGSTNSFTLNTAHGGVDNGVLVTMISESEYQAAQAINGTEPKTLPIALTNLNRNIFYPEMYGTIGAGSDEDAINAAIDAADAAGGGIVVLGASTYTIDGPILYRSNVSIIGRGQGGSQTAENHGVTDAGTLITYTGSATAITTGGSGVIAGVRLEGFKLKSSGSGLIGIELKSVQQSVIEDVVVHDFDQIGIHLTGHSLTGWTGAWWNRIANVTVECGYYTAGHFPQGIGIKLDGSNTIDDEIRDANSTHLEKCLIRWCNVGVWLEGTGNTLIECDITNCKTAVVEANVNTAYMANTYIGNRIEENTGIEGDLFAQVVELDSGKILTITSPTGTFEKLEEVEGGTSGATGYIYFVDATRMILGNVSGTFTSETITGADSGATASVTAVADDQFNVTGITTGTGVEGDQVTLSAAPPLKNGWKVKLAGTDSDAYNDRYFTVYDVSGSTFRLLGRQGETGGTGGTCTIVATSYPGNSRWVHGFAFKDGATQIQATNGYYETPTQWIANSFFQAEPFNSGWAVSSDDIGVAPVHYMINISSIDDITGNLVQITTTKPHGLSNGTYDLQVRGTANFDANYNGASVTVISEHAFEFATSNTGRALETVGQLIITDNADNLINSQTGIKLTHSAGLSFYYPLAGFSWFGGRVMTAVAMVKTSAANGISVRLADNVQATKLSQNHSGSDTWERLCARIKVSPEATALTVSIFCNDKHASPTVYVGSVELFDGTVF